MVTGPEGHLGNKVKRNNRSQTKLQRRIILLPPKVKVGRGQVQLWPGLQNEFKANLSEPWTNW